MALPTVAKTWRFNVNNKRATTSNLFWHQALMFNLKDILINNSPILAWDTPPTGIWTVDHSCDGSTAGTPADGIDRWVTTANLVWDRPADAHSWIVFNTGMNGGLGQVLIDLDNDNNSSVGAEPESIDVRISPGGLFTGGTTTARPTASDELPGEITRGQTAGAWAGLQTATGLDIGYHVMMSADGAEMRIFMHRTNVCFSMWAFGESVDGPAGAAHNLWGSIWSTAQSTPTEALNMVQTSGWFHGSNSGVIRGIGSLQRPVYLDYIHQSGNQSLWKNTIVPGIGDETLGEAVFGEISMWDTDSAGNRGPKGRIQDMWVITDARTNGDTFPADGSRQFHKVGANMVVPWSGAIPENFF
jgi:hypothetical protein